MKLIRDDEIFDRINKMRENGETDLRSALWGIDDCVKVCCQDCKHFDGEVTCNNMNMAVVPYMACTKFESTKEEDEDEW